MLVVLLLLLLRLEIKLPALPLLVLLRCTRSKQSGVEAKG